MINPLKSISVTNCLNILLMIKIILPWILLPFPFLLIISSLCFRKISFVSNIRDIQNDVIKLKLCSPQKSDLLRFQILLGESHILSQTVENGQILTMFYKFKIWDSFQLKIPLRFNWRKALSVLAVFKQGSSGTVECTSASLCLCWADSRFLAGKRKWVGP